MDSVFQQASPKKAKRQLTAEQKQVLCERLAKARPKAIEARRRKAQLNRMERERVREQEDQELAAWMSRSKSKVLPPASVTASPPTSSPALPGPSPKAEKQASPPLQRARARALPHCSRQAS